MVKKQMINVAIIGYGWVGKAMHKLFPDAVVYDPFIDKYSFKAIKNKVNKCDVAFICVPTPNTKNSVLDTSIVEEVIKWCEADLLVIRSTVNPGDCNYFENNYEKNICMQPEYLGETVNHPMLDPRTRQFLIIGGGWENRRKLIEFYKTVYNANINIRQVTNLEAEVIKLSENRAIAFKVAQCQELFDVCEVAGVDYNTVREAVYGDDPRFNLWWTFVFEKNRGMDSKCLPKDVYAFCAWAESIGYNPVITKGILERNKKWLKK